VDGRGLFVYDFLLLPNMGSFSSRMLLSALYVFHARYWLKPNVPSFIGPFVPQVISLIVFVFPCRGITVVMAGLNHCTI